MNASRFAISPNRSKVPERRSRNRIISASLRGVSSLTLRPAQCGCRYSLQRVPPRKVLDDFCGVRFSVANAASRARRNTRSLAIFVRYARARCSYSGIERGPPDSGSCLKRSSASSLEVMKLSSAFSDCVTPSRLMWRLRGSTARRRELFGRRGGVRGRVRRNPRALCHLWFEAPELKAMSADGLFDRITGKIVRRSVPGRDRTNLSPGTKLIWQIATGYVSGESSQTGFWI